MGLNEELNLKKPFQLRTEESLLNVLLTASQMAKGLRELLRPFGITEVQYNVLQLLRHQAPPEQGLTLSEISEMMMVRPANISTLATRLERAGLVERFQNVDDRRSFRIRMTAKGRSVNTKTQEIYFKNVEEIMTELDEGEQAQLIMLMERLREKITSHLG